MLKVCSENLPGRAVCGGRERFQKVSLVADGWLIFHYSWSLRQVFSYNGQHDMVGKGELIESIRFRDLKTEIFQQVLLGMCFWCYNCNRTKSILFPVEPKKGNCCLHHSQRMVRTPGWGFLKNNVGIFRLENSTPYKSHTLLFMSLAFGFQAFYKGRF